MMNIDKTPTAEMRGWLKSIVGRRLTSYLYWGMDDDTSILDVFLLNVEGRFIEVRVYELSKVSEFADDTTVMRVCSRESPEKPSDIPDKELFVDSDTWTSRTVGKTVTGIALAVNRDFEYDDDGKVVLNTLDYARGLVIYFGDEALVFDKAHAWTDFWDVRHCRADEVSFDPDDCEDEHPYTRRTVRLERL